MMMEPVNGLRLKAFFLKNLEKIADLIYFDGPLLSHFKNEDGDSYLYYWCDADEVYNRWLVFRVTDEDLNQYLLRQSSLREIILDLADGFMYVADIDDDLNFDNVYIIQPEDLPTVYFPDVDSFYEFEPVYAEQEHERRQQEKYRILLDKAWSLKDLAEFPRVYSQVYAFLYSFQAPLAEADDVEKLRSAYTTYPWQGGYSTVGFYNKIQKFVHPDHKPDISAIQYASPGWMDLELFNPTALLIEKIVLSFVKSEDELKTLYKNVYKELGTRKLIKFNVQLKDSKLNEENKKFIDESVRHFAELMEFEYIDRINDLADNPLTILKILLSFYRRIFELTQYQLSGKIRFYR